MEPTLIVLGLIAAGTAWHWFLYKLSGRPWWNPLWMSFTLAATSILYVIAGSLGYVLDRRDWIDAVVWSQVWTGLAFAAAAVLFWRIARRPSASGTPA